MSNRRVATCNLSLPVRSVGRDCMDYLSGLLRGTKVGKDAGLIDTMNHLSHGVGLAHSGHFVDSPQKPRLNPMSRLPYLFTCAVSPLYYRYRWAGISWGPGRSPSISNRAMGRSNEDNPR